MATLLDKLGKKSMNPNQFVQQAQMPNQVAQPQNKSPLPTINEQIEKPATLPLSERLSGLKPKGMISETRGIKGRAVADLPANVQIQGIQQILSGQDTNNPFINNFVREQAARGRSPEEIRLAFIEHQKSSPDPLVLM